AFSFVPLNVAPVFWRRLGWTLSFPYENPVAMSISLLRRQFDCAPWNRSAAGAGDGVAGHAVALDFAGETVIRRPDGEEEIDVVAFERGIGDFHFAITAGGGGVDDLIFLVERQDDHLLFVVAAVPIHVP